MSKQMKRLDESVLSVADTAYAFRFLKLLITPWEKTSAYKEGLIDKNGKRDKSVKIKTKQQKESYTIFHRLVYNIKRLVGNTKFTSFVSALYLIKEGVKEDFVNTELNKSVDELYGKPYDEKKTGDCTKYIYKLIPESKAEIDKLVKSGIY